MFFSENDVERIIGQKKGNTEIGLLLKKGNVDEEAEELSLNVSNSPIAVFDLKEDLLKMRSYDWEFKDKFTLFLVDKLIHLT